MNITLVAGTILGTDGTAPLAPSAMALILGDAQFVAVTLVGGTGFTDTAMAGGGVTTWALVGRYDNGTDVLELWWGVVTTQGAASITLTTTWTGGVTTEVAEFTTDVPATWTLDGAASITSGPGLGLTAVPFATLTPATTGELRIDVVNAAGGTPTVVDPNPYEGWGSQSNQLVNYVTNAGTAGVPFTPAAGQQAVPAAWCIVGTLVKATPTGAAGLPPLAPTLTSPLPSAVVDLQRGWIFGWTYYTGGSAPETGYQLRQKIGAGAYTYWNAVGFGWSSSPVTNSPSNNGFAVIPASRFTDGNSYDWSVASVDTGGVGPFASDSTVIAAASPRVTLLAPFGSYTTNGTPTVMWTTTFAAGETQSALRVATYSLAQYSAPGFVPFSGPSLDDSGIVSSSASTYTIVQSLPNGAVCRVYVTVWQGPDSAYGTDTSDFTMTITAPSAPMISAVASTNPTSGAPAVAVTVLDTGTGGLAAASIVVGRGDGTYLTNASLAAPHAIAPHSTTVLYDHETPDLRSYSYTAWAVSAGGIFSASSGWSVPVVVNNAGFYMWIPSNPDGAIKLHLASRVSSASVASGGDAVLVINRPEDQGVFKPFGRSDSVVVRGDMRDEEFDLTLVFLNNVEWNAFEAIRNQQRTVCVRTDMSNKIYYVALGETRNVAILRGDRLDPAGPIRQLTITCTPVAKPGS